MKPIAATEARTPTPRIPLQVDRQKLCQLIQAGHLCATDFVCLDCHARDAVKRMFLQCSLRG